MPSASYSFLDIAVLDEVRQRFAAGDALAVLSSDLASVLWANGPGAKLFGAADIEQIIGTESRLTPVARRQVSPRTLAIPIGLELLQQPTRDVRHDVAAPERRMAAALFPGPRRHLSYRTAARSPAVIAVTPKNRQESAR